MALTASRRALLSLVYYLYRFFDRNPALKLEKGGCPFPARARERETETCSADCFPSRLVLRGYGKDGGQLQQEK